MYRTGPSAEAPKEYDPPFGQSRSTIVFGHHGGWVTVNANSRPAFLRRCVTFLPREGFGPCWPGLRS